MTELLYDIPEAYFAEALALGAILKAPPKNTRQTRRTSDAAYSAHSDKHGYQDRRKHEAGMLAAMRALIGGNDHE